MPSDDDLARRGLQDAGYALEQGGLPRTVTSDDPESLARLDGEFDVPKCPEVLVGNVPRVKEPLL
jgi:hypothetical protein